MSRQVGRKLIQWSTRAKSTEEIVNQLTIPLKEHEKPLRMLTINEKKEAVRLKMKEINISIDSLDKRKFALMTRRDGFDKVWKSIELARNYFPKVKLNVVVIRNQNDNEIVDFVKLTENRNLDIRFIEFMPFGGNEFKNNQFYGYREMLNLIVEKFGENVIRLSDSPNDTTKAYKIQSYQGQFGFITSMSDHFCNTCNRLRITADGNLKVCLHGNSEVSLRDKLRGGDSDEQLSEVIQTAVNNKKARHAGMDALKNLPNRPMILIGG
uniref:Mob_synth_C domain-containing protein n=1 Tax=Caenorhabditis tropicalis TaxID=1561998 RepID=A0A1I7TZX0_9PELO